MLPGTGGGTAKPTFSVIKRYDSGCTSNFAHATPSQLRPLPYRNDKWIFPYEANFRTSRLKRPCARPAGPETAAHFLFRPARLIADGKIAGHDNRAQRGVGDQATLTWYESTADSQDSPPDTALLGGPARQSIDLWYTMQWSAFSALLPSPQRRSQTQSGLPMTCGSAALGVLDE